jgi:hypothetical protein
MALNRKMVVLKKKNCDVLVLWNGTKQTFDQARLELNYPVIVDRMDIIFDHGMHVRGRDVPGIVIIKGGSIAWKESDVQIVNNAYIPRNFSKLTNSVAKARGH